jgi:hypothetical protein
MKTSRRKSKGNPKRAILIFVLVCVVCLVGVLVLTCGKETITSDQAYEIVLKDLGLTSQDVASPHIHEGTYENQSCYNIYVTVNGKSLTYVVSTKGEILHKGEGGHSH